MVFNDLGSARSHLGAFRSVTLAGELIEKSGAMTGGSFLGRSSSLGFGSSNDNDEIEKLSEELEKLKEEKLRLLAEMENLRKRSEKEKLDSIRYGSINLARDILSPGDNLSRALEAIPEDEKSSEKFKNLIIFLFYLFWINFEWGILLA